MECPWDGQSAAAECGQPPLPLIPAIIMGSKGPFQSSVFQPGIPLLYWAACIWSLSPTEKLPPLSQEPPQHPVLSAHKCAQKPVLHVVAIYYRRGPQEAYSIDYKKVEIDFIGSGVGGKLACTVERWRLGDLMRNNERTKGSSCPRMCFPTFFVPCNPHSHINNAQSALHRHRNRTVFLLNNITLHVIIIIS